MNTTSSGDDTPVIRGSALGALNGEEKWVKAIEELMEAVDTYIPTPTRDTDKTILNACRRRIHNHWSWVLLLLGRVERGMLKLNEPLEIVGIRETKSTVATGIEMFRKLLDFAEAG